MADAVTNPGPNAVAMIPAGVGNFLIFDNLSLGHSLGSLGPFDYLLQARRFR